MSATQMQHNAPIQGGFAAAAPAGAPALIQVAEQSAQTKPGAADSSAAPQAQVGHSPAPGQMATGTQVPAKPKTVFPPFDAHYFPSHLLWLVITFGFFYLFMARVVLPRIGGIIETRHDRIAADLDQAARLKAQSDAAVTAYQNRLAEARDKAKEIAHAAEEQAKAKAETERKSVETAMEGQLAETERRLAASRDAALAQVDNMAEAAAAEIIKKISGITADAAGLAKAVKAAQMPGSAA